MLAKGYTELSGLFRTLQCDALAVVTLFLCGWAAGYRIDTQALQFPELPSGLRREDFKLFGDLGGLAVATTLIALVLFTVQGILSFGNTLISLIYSLLPNSLREVDKRYLNLQAMMYIASALPEDQCTSEQLCKAYFVFSEQRGLTKQFINDDGHHRYLQDRASYYYALEGRFALFVLFAAIFSVFPSLSINV